MSSFDELRARVEAAERQFNAMSRQRRDYGQRLIDMIAMHERNLAESGEQLHVLRQEAIEARALADERGRALDKARGENEQLRQMLHGLLTAIERNRSNEFEDTMLELDRRISSMVAADSDGPAQTAGNAEISQAPDTWRPADEMPSEDAGPGAGAPADGDAMQGGDSRAEVTAGDMAAIPGPDPETDAPGSAAPDREADGTQSPTTGVAPTEVQDEEDVAGMSDSGIPDAMAVDPGMGQGSVADRPAGEDLAAGDLVAADWPDEADLATPVQEGGAVPEEGAVPEGGAVPGGAPALAPVEADRGDAPLSLEEVLELAEASAEEQAVNGLSGINGDRLTAEDLATLTEMLEESVAAAEEETAEEEGHPVQAAPQASIAEIADRIRAEQVADLEAAEADGPPGEDSAGEGGDDTRFELLDEAELQKGMTADRLFSADDYAEDGFGPVASAEAEAEAGRNDDDEGEDENAFDLSDLDLGGEIDGPPEAESENGPAEAATGEGAEDGGFEIIDDDPFDTGEAGAMPGAAPTRERQPAVGAGAPDVAASATRETDATTSDGNALDANASDAGADSVEEVTAEEEAELERWRAEVLGRVAQEAQEAAARHHAGGRAGGDGSGTGRPTGAAPHRATSDIDGEDDALAELDAILAEEDRSFAAEGGASFQDAGEWSAEPPAGRPGPADDDAGAGSGFGIDLDSAPGPDLDIPPLNAEPRGTRGLAPALRDRLDADTRAEILARVRQSHSDGGRDPDN